MFHMNMSMISHRKGSNVYLHFEEPNLIGPKKKATGEHSADDELMIK